MSELKVASCFEFEKVLSRKSNKLFYSKSEADKVIADKDAKILALDAEVFKQKHHAKLFLDERNYAETQLRHQKYKRCLSKAKAEQFVVDIMKPYMESALRDTIPELWQQRHKRHQRHLERWLALVNYFKEEA